MNETKKMMPSYRDEDTSILPLPTFVTVEAPDRVDSSANNSGRPRRAMDDWERDISANLNRMAVDEQYRLEIAARQS